MLAAFEPEGMSYTVAARVSGPAKTAFPDGPPDAVETPEVRAAHKAESESPLNMIVVADADILADQNWAQVQRLLGQSITVPIANNGDFTVNALDNLSGSSGLISLRGRGFNIRPFEILQAMERDAEQQFRAKEVTLLEKIEATQAKIQDLQQKEKEGRRPVDRGATGNHRDLPWRDARSATRAARRPARPAQGRRSASDVDQGPEYLDRAGGILRYRHRHGGGPSPARCQVPSGAGALGRVDSLGISARGHVMSRTAFLVWAVLAAVTVVAAGVFAFKRPDVATVQFTNEPAFPALRADPEAVTRVEVTAPGESFALVRDADGNWGAESKFGYPVDRDKILKLVVAMSDMRLIEAKTARTDLYARLQVEDVTEEHANSRVVKLSSGADEVVADVIVGKRKTRYTGGNREGTYIRRSGDAQAWLVSGGLSIQGKLRDWLVKTVVNISSGDVQRVQFSLPSGVSYEVVKATENDELQLVDPPAGAEPNEQVVGQLSVAMNFVDLDDVKPRAQLVLPAEPYVTVVTTFSGAQVTAKLAGVGDDAWAVYEAAYVGDEAADSEAGKAGRELVDQINKRVEGWAYKLPQHVTDRMTKPLSDLLKVSDGAS